MYKKLYFVSCGIMTFSCAILFIPNFCNDLNQNISTKINKTLFLFII